MRLDLRIPIGLLFLVYGTLLTLYGLLGSQSRSVGSPGLNADAAWGVVLLAAGAGFLLTARRSRAARARADKGAARIGAPPGPP